MAGHSKWKNIQHRKGAQDAKRGKVFTKLIREITVAAKLGGEDPNSNPRLRTAVDKALGQNMSKDTVQRAIKKGVGGEEGANLSEVRYEGYGPGGVAVMVNCLTDNKNRTVSEVRHAFTKCGGNLGTDGSVSYLFIPTGLITFSKGSNENTILEVALDAGARDVITNEDGTIDVLTDPENFLHIKDQLSKKQLQPAASEVTMLASTEVTIDDEENAAQIVKLSDMLEELDDVQNVYTNADIPDELLEKI